MLRTLAVLIVLLPAVAIADVTGQTMHQVDERTPTADLAALTRIYRAVLDRYFAAA